MPWDLFSLRRIFADLDRRLNHRYLTYQVFQEKKGIKAFLDRTRDTADPVKFSIVIPTYGIQAVLINECIRSIIRQTYQNWEICLYNDGDRSPKVERLLTGFQERLGEKFKLASASENQGICVATGRALAMASGEFIVFIDADDQIHKRSLEVLAHQISAKPDADFLYTDHDYMSESGFRKFPMAKPAWSPETLLFVNYINHLTVVRHSLVREHTNLFDRALDGSQDWNLCLEMSFVSRRTVHIPFALYHWRVRPGSMAENVMSKPWAVQAQARVRNNFFKKLVPNSLFNGRYYEIADTKTIKIAFVHLGQRNDTLISELNCGSFPISHQSMELTAGTLIEPLIRKVLHACDGLSDDDILFFVDAKKNSIRGHLPAFVVMAKIPKVAVVYPFVQSQLRCCYTLGRKRGMLVQLQRPNNAFYRYSGNVLTGACHGMAIECRKLKKLERELASIGDTRLPQSGHISDFLGAWIGLKLFAMEYRNVSISAVTCSQELASLSLSSSLMPNVDPYN